MNCKRCKTVELIRIEHLPMNLVAPWEYINPPVDRCPCCGLEWAVTLPKPFKEPTKESHRSDDSVLPVTEFIGVMGNGKTIRVIDEAPLLFRPIVGGFAQNDASEP